MNPALKHSLLFGSLLILALGITGHCFLPSEWASLTDTLLGTSLGVIWGMEYERRKELRDNLQAQAELKKQLGVALEGIKESVQRNIKETKEIKKWAQSDSYNYATKLESEVWDALKGNISRLSTDVKKVSLIALFYHEIAVLRQLVDMRRKGIFLEIRVLLTAAASTGELAGHVDRQCDKVIAAGNDVLGSIG